MEQHLQVISLPLASLAYSTSNIVVDSDLACSMAECVMLLRTWYIASILDYVTAFHQGRREGGKGDKLPRAPNWLSLGLRFTLHKLSDTQDLKMAKVDVECKIVKN